MRIRMITVALMLTVAGLVPATASAQHSVPTNTLIDAISRTDLIVTFDTAVEVGNVVVTPFETMTVLAFEDADGLRVRVARGQSGTSATAHPVRTIAWVDEARYFRPRDPNGSCGFYPVAPYVNVNGPSIWECLNGLWHRYDFGLSVSQHLQVFPGYTFPGTPIRENFERTIVAYHLDGFRITSQTQGVGDGHENVLYGSLLGNLMWYEERGAKAAATASWRIIDGRLNIAENDADNEGMGWVIAPYPVGTNEYGGWVVPRSFGGCISLVATVADVSKVDEFVVGFRSQVGNAMQDVVASYTYVHGTGLEGGNIIQFNERAGATFNADTVADLADGQRVGLKSCIADDGHVVSYFAANVPADEADAPVWIENRNRNGSINTAMQTAAGEMVPFVSFFSQQATEGDIWIDWVELDH